jgi:hypothetical protein
MLLCPAWDADEDPDLCDSDEEDGAPLPTRHCDQPKKLLKPAGRGPRAQPSYLGAKRVSVGIRHYGLATFETPASVRSSDRHWTIDP